MTAPLGGETVPAVRMRGVSKRFGTTVALRGLDLELHPGEVLGFLGPNGSGKTTTVRVLLGLLRRTVGDVEVFGLDPWRRATAVHADTGYVPGDVRLPSRTTAGRLLHHYAKLRGGVPEDRLQELAARLHLDLATPVGSLSKGNRQKVALVQALMGRPRLLVLDEPTSGLDPLAQEEFGRLVRERTQQGTAVLLSSHVLAEVERVADRVAVLRHGRLVTVERLETLQTAARHHVRVRLDAPGDARLLEDVAGLSALSVRGDLLSCTVPAASLDAVVKALARTSVREVTIERADLEELFLSYYGEDAGVR